jgi:hypothetical protein
MRRVMSRVAVGGGRALAVWGVLFAACQSHPLPIAGRDAGGTGGAGGAGGAGGGAPGSGGSRDAGAPPDAGVSLETGGPRDTGGPVTDGPIFIGDDAGLDPGACNSVPLLGSQVALQCSMRADPTPRGGQILDGLYVLTAVIQIGACGPSTVTLSETVLISNGTIYAAAQSPDGQIQRTNGTYSTSGPELTFNQTCPSMGLEVDRYDADPMTLTLYASPNPGTLLIVLTRQ